MASRLANSLATMILCAGCAGCAGTQEDSAPATSSPEAMDPTFDPESGTNVGGASWSVRYGFGGLWVQVDPPVDQVIKVNANSADVEFGVPKGRGVAIARDSVWVATGKMLLNVDPATGKTLSSIPASTSYLAVGAGSVWALSDGSLQRYDPRSGALRATVPLTSQEATDLVATDDAVWVTSKLDGSVVRVDPATDSEVASVKTGAGAHGIVVDDSGVWVTNYTENTVSRIDPATNKVVATINDVGSGVGIAAGDGSIWVSTKSEGVAQIDPSTNKVTRLAPAAAWPYWAYGVAYHDGDLWVSSAGESQSLHQVKVTDLCPSC